MFSLEVILNLKLLAMVFHYKDRQEVLNTSEAKGYQLATVFNHELVHLTISPKQEVLPHSLPVPVTFYVITGTGVISINKQSFEVNIGDVVAVSANETRSWTNTGKESLELLVIKEMP